MLRHLARHVVPPHARVAGVRCLARRTGRERASAADADGPASDFADLAGGEIGTDGAGGRKSGLSSALRTGHSVGKGTEAPGLSWTGANAGKSSSPGLWDDDDDFIARRPQQPSGGGKRVDKSFDNNPLGSTDGLRMGKGSAQSMFSDSEDEQPTKGRKGKGKGKNRFMDASDSEDDGPIQGFGLKGKGGAKGKSKAGVQSGSDDEDDPPRYDNSGQGKRGGKGFPARDQGFGGAYSPRGEHGLAGAGGKGFRSSSPSPGDEYPRRSRFGDGYPDSDDEFPSRGGRGRVDGAGRGEEHFMHSKGGKAKGMGKGMKGTHSDSDGEFRGSKGSKGKGSSKGLSEKGGKGKGKSKGSSFGMF